jgi:hypothetical protein
MTPNDELLTGETAAFVADLRAAAHGPVPEASAELQALFAATATVIAPPATTTPRRSPVSDAKRLLTAIPSKVAAGVLGALLAGSLGAGAMTGTISLASNDSDVPETTEVLVDDEALEDEELVEKAEVEEVEEVEVDEDEAGDDEAKAVVDPMVPPTSVSEAARNHHFDEACGNHGAYVSHFARTGEEPECAVAARAALAADAPADAEADADADADAAETESDAVESEVQGPGKSDQGKAKASAAKAKAAERKAAGGKGKPGR